MSGRWERRVAIGLGANLPPREESLRLAVFKLTSLPGCQLLGVSSLYESPAWKCEPGAPEFLNAALILETGKRPAALLEALQRLEREIGGPRPTRRAQPDALYASRRLDLDLLLVGLQTIREDNLRVPHPGVYNRDFMLRPLCELAPDWPIPPQGRTAAELLAAAPGDEPVCRIVAGPGWTRPPGPMDL